MQLQALEAKAEEGFDGFQGEALALEIPVEANAERDLEALGIGEGQAEIADELAAVLNLDSQKERLVGCGQLDVGVAFQPAQDPVFVQRHAILVAEELLVRHQFQQILPVTPGQAP